MTKLDLDSTYDIHHVSQDLRTFSFISILKNGEQVELVIRITKHRDPHLSGVYNLAFGPIDITGEIDDKIVLKHADLGKVFSTIMLCAITFLDNNEPGISIGIDGFNDVRAYLYHRMFVSNHKKLAELITTVGVDWYVRLLRNGTDIERDAESYPLFKPRPEPFDLNRASVDLYRYYMFSLSE